VAGCSAVGTDRSARAAQWATSGCFISPRVCRRLSCALLSSVVASNIVSTCEATYARLVTTAHILLVCPVPLKCVCLYFGRWRLFFAAEDALRRHCGAHREDGAVGPAGEQGADEAFDSRTHESQGLGGRIRFGVGSFGVVWTSPGSVDTRG
jgi:hypothetical protein